MPALDRIGNATILRKPIGPDALFGAVHDPPQAHKSLDR
jgi:hypothetical protein